MFNSARNESDSKTYTVEPAQIRLTAPPVLCIKPVVNSGIKHYQSQLPINWSSRMQTEPSDLYWHAVVLWKFWVTRRKWRDNLPIWAN